jgi:hypothetical protein
LNDFITIKTFDNFVTANFARQKLEEQEISCYLADEYTITIQWVLSNAIGGIKLMVPKDDVNKAIQILNEEPGQVNVEFEIEGNELRCPVCGSSNTVAEKFSRPVAGLTWLILGFPIRFKTGKTNFCFYCGNKWRK